MSALYNEIEPFAVEWTRKLIEAGHVAPGRVETRSISDLTPQDLVGFDQFHTFSGIAVWSHALRQAGFPDDAEVWTGSCPCQPLSNAGRKKGFEDERHLWPDWFKLIRECHPPIVFGEQVASPLGMQWLDLVFSDLEAQGYACAAADLAAASVGAPHIRQRTYFVAIADGERLERVRVHLRKRRSQQAVLEARGSGTSVVVADDASAGRESRWGLGESSDGRRTPRLQPGRLRNARRVDDTSGARSGRDAGAVPGEEREGARERREFGRVLDFPVAPGPTRGFWAPADWVLCRDGKARPVEPGAFPLANGATARMGRLRGTGNAIVGPLAQAFVESVVDVLIGE